MRQAPKLWVPIVATVIFGGAGATTWMWVTSTDQVKSDAGHQSLRQAIVARAVTPSEADRLASAPSLPTGATSMTVDDKFVYVYSGNKLMKVDKNSLQIVNSADLIAAGPAPKSGKHQIATPSLD